MSNFWTSEEERRLAEKYEEVAKARENISELEKYFDRSKDALEKKIRQLRSRGEVQYYDDYAPEVSRDGESINISGQGYDHLQDILEASDIDPEEWRVDKIKRWEVAQKGGSKLPLWSIQAKRNKQKLYEKITKDIIEAVEEASPEPSNYRYENIRDCSNRHMLELSTFDLHLGKMAWGEETGEDYDLDIAEKVFKEAVLDTLSKVDVERFPLEEIVWVLGQDYFNVDNSKGTTTSGTPQDIDNRWQKMFDVGFRLARWLIDTASKIAPVKVVVNPGNHDTEYTYFLGEVLKAWYRKHGNVEIDNRPKTRKYIKFGVNLIGFAHGKDEKLKALPMIMASEAADLWEDNQVREMHVGHFHHRKSTQFIPNQEIRGVMLRILPPLTASDAWHTKMGFVGNFRGAESYLWNKETGLSQIIYTSV